MAGTRGSPSFSTVALVIAVSFACLDIRGEVPVDPSSNDAVSAGNEDPTAAETVEYIERKLRGCDSRTGSLAPSVAVEEGTMSVQSISLLEVRRGEAFFDGRDGGTVVEDWTARMTVDLTDLSREVGEPSPIRVWVSESFTVRIQCAKPRCIRYVGSGPFAGSDTWPMEIESLREGFRDPEFTTAVNVGAAGDQLNEWAFVLCGVDTAQRVRRALVHLLALGGAEGELF